LTSGRYILPEDLQCPADQYGIVIEANDVFLDCQDHTVTGDVSGSTPTIGIRIFGSSDVTITNCHVSNFFDGLAASGFGGNILIGDSSFDQNSYGAVIFPRNVGTVGTVVIVNSHFDNNKGYGMELQSGVSIISSTAIGNIQGGVVALANNVLVWDSEFSNNGSEGLFFDAALGAQGSVVKSIVCGNNGVDVATPTISQAVTCATTFPTDIGDNQVCQCPCSSGNLGVTLGVVGEVVPDELANTTTHTPRQPIEGPS
jgi:hypothetical protein